MNSMILCCGRAGCPSVRYENEKITIKDDYGGEVIMDKEHFNELKKFNPE